MNEFETISLQATIPEELSGGRFDQVAAKLFPSYSRSRLKSWIESGELTLDGESNRPRQKVQEGQTLRIEATLDAPEEWSPEDLDLDIVYEDEHLLLINKPAGFVVHPGAGNWSGTLLNGLLHRYPELGQIPRAGIVHRIDKDTTGLMVVARTLEAHTHLVNQLQERTLTRQYEAITQGVMVGGGSVNKPMGRHPVHRKKMAVIEHGGKPAVTHYRVVKRYRIHTHIRVQLETGRTHQIRVHMAHARYPLLGDPVYLGRARLPAGGTEEFKESILRFGRQALHAKFLGMEHPATGEWMEWEIPLPQDMVDLLEVLKKDQQDHA
ncbi:MAG: 23S rRNA pseudouridine(1911/1915/1917) synthase RluD [Pseudomonadales bacterium]|nr:23S rRNA pseudouridine(1911/1915/1917) synthase RluD [Pseudomonadales bacterium]